MNANSIAWMLLLLPLMVAIAILPGRKRAPGLCALLATGSALITFVLALLLSLSEWGQGEVKPIPWIVSGEDEDSFRIIIGLELDRLSRGMMIAITGIAFSVYLFFLIRMKDDDKQSPPFFELTLFLFAAVGIVFSDSLVMMFFFWGMMSFISYMLAGHQRNRNLADESFMVKVLLSPFAYYSFLLGILFVWAAIRSVYFRDVPDSLDVIESKNMLNGRILFLFFGVISISVQAARNVRLSHKGDSHGGFSRRVHMGSLLALGAYSVARLSPFYSMLETSEKTTVWIIYIICLILLPQNPRKLSPSKT